MADKVTIQVTPSGYLIVTGSGVIPSGTFSIVNCELKQSDGSSPTDGLYTLKRDTLSTLFINQKYSDIINGATGLAFTSIPALNTYISSNFSPSIAGGTGTPGGATTQVQYNLANAFAGDSGLVYKTGQLTVGSYVPAPTGKNLWVFGDSITVGWHASSNAARWSTLLANALGLTEQNFGSAGATLEHQTPNNPISGTTDGVSQISNIPTKTSNDAYLIFMYGINDWGAGYTNYNPTNMSADYTTVINAAKAKGWPANLIYVTSVTYCKPVAFGLASPGGGTLNEAGLLAFSTAIQNMCTATGVNYVDVYQITKNNLGADKNMFDNVHPNDYGYYNYFKILQSAISAYVYDNGQAGIYNGVLQPKSLNLNTIPVLSINSGRPIGVDVNGQVGTLSALPNQFSLNYPNFLSGASQYNVETPTLTMPDGTTPISNSNDFLLLQGTKLTSVLSGTAGTVVGSIQICDSAGAMNFINNFQHGKYNFYVTNSNTSGVMTGGLMINYDGSIAVGQIINLANNYHDHNRGDIMMLQNAAVGYNDATQTCYYQPFDSSGNSNFYNTYANGAFRFFSSAGTNGGKVQAFTIYKSGKVTVGGTTDDTVNALQVTGSIKSTAPVITSSGYTVSTLPAGTVGMIAYVTDAVSPSYLGALTGSGTVKVPVFYNGSSWISI